MSFVSGRHVALWRGFHAGTVVAIALCLATLPERFAIPAELAQPLLPPPPLPKTATASPQSAVAELPPGFTPWWHASVSRPLAPRLEPKPLDLGRTIAATLAYSSQVRVIADGPLIRRAGILEAEGVFDLRTFMESKFIDTSDPVGSSLTTGGPNRFIDQNWYYAVGVRRRSSTGAELEASQKIGYEDSNSLFFVPFNQGTARLNVSLTQPLWRGAGRDYNTAGIVLAQINTTIAHDELSRDLQKLLLNVHRSYWDLHLQRAILLQKRSLFAKAVTILEELDARRDVDVLGSQLVRARAAVAEREAATIRLATSVRNAETRLRTQMNDPALARVDGFELIPSEPPELVASRVDLNEALITALEYRPEISMVAKEIRAASLRENVAKNELMPALDLVLGAYVSGLQGQGDIGQSLGDQFAVGRPTYTAGLVFDSPWCNRAARGRFEQRRLEVRRMANQLETTTAEVRADVETAVREVETTHREMVSKYHAMQADQAEIDYLTSRWKQLPREGQAAGVVLDDLLEAQERLASSELGFATALVTHQLAKVQVRWATGALLLDQNIQLEEIRVDCLPQLQLAHPLVPPPAPHEAAPATNPTLESVPPERDARRIIRLPSTCVGRTIRLPAVR